MLHQDALQAEEAQVSFKIDPHSATWLCIKDYAESRMKDIRTRLESNLGFEETQQLRARLSELKGILESTTVEVPVVDSDFELPG